MRQTVCVYLINEKWGKILLAMTKRGFSLGKINGIGGKIETGETPAQAAVREVKEEIEVTLREEDLMPVADNTFLFKDRPDWDTHNYEFFVYRWDGEPQETDEMAPAWYDITKIPYEKTWLDHTFWLPDVLMGYFVKGVYHYNGDGSKILGYNVEAKSFL